MLNILHLSGFLLSFAILSSCTTPGSRRASETASIPTDVDMVLTGDDNIQDRPSAYVGKTILAKGEVKSILSSNAFLLNYGGGIFGVGDNQILIVRETQTAGVSISLGTKVEVIGVVRLFNLLQMERELGTDLNDNAFKKYQDAPVLIARTILNRP